MIKYANLIAPEHLEIMMEDPIVQIREELPVIPESETWDVIRHSPAK